uniref:Clathrin light chain n=1 Tax=Steinernema glaseri TaxID=37863 RepID=A0A1I7YCK2_9BILA
MALGETSKPIDMVSPEIPFIQPRKSKSISKEEFENVSQQEPIPPPPSLIECLRSEEEQKGIKVAENLALMDQKHRTSSEHELGSDNDYSQKDPTNKWKKLIEEAVKHLGVEEVRNIAEQTKSAVTLECVSTPTPRPCPRPRDLSRIQSTLPANI